MSKEWFDETFPEIDGEFESWWLEFYGPPENYGQGKDEQDEYWKRKGFALHGWRAGYAEGQQN